MTIRYHLTIEQVTENEAYATEMEDYTRRQRYEGYGGGSSEAPQRERSLKVLSVTVTDVEFAAIKKAALAVMA